MATFKDLPIEILLQILSILETPHKLTVSRVSSRLYELIMPILYRDVRFYEFAFINSSMPSNNSARGKCLKKLMRSLRGHPILSSYVRTLVLDINGSPWGHGSKPGESSSMHDLINQLPLLKQSHVSFGFTVPPTELPATVTSIYIDGLKLQWRLIRQMLLLPNLSALELHAQAFIRDSSDEPLGPGVSNVKNLYLDVRMCSEELFK